MLVKMDLPVFDSLVREMDPDEFFDMLWEYKLTGVMPPSVKDPEGLVRDLDLLWAHSDGSEAVGPRLNEVIR